MLWWCILAVAVALSVIVSALVIAHISRERPKMIEPEPPEPRAFETPKRITESGIFGSASSREHTVNLTKTAFVHQSGARVFTDSHAEGWNGYTPAATDEYYAVPKVADRVQDGYLNICPWGSKTPVARLEEAGLVPVFVAFHALTAYVGYFDSSNYGTVILYTQVNGEWKKTQTIAGHLGFGRTIAVHDLQMLVSDQKSVYIYTRESWASEWALVTVLGSTLGASMLYGFAVCISRDYIVISSPYIDDSAGAVYVYPIRSGSGDRVTIESPGHSKHFGFALALDRHHLWAADDDHVYGFDLLGGPKRTHTFAVDHPTTLSLAGGRLVIGTESGIHVSSPPNENQHKK
jgi:hypothetical protein